SGRRERGGTDVRSPVHRLEVGPHGLQGPFVAAVARFGEEWVADPQPEDEPVRIGLGQRPRPVRHRHGVAGPDARDARPHHPGERTGASRRGKKGCAGSAHLGNYPLDGCTAMCYRPKQGKRRVAMSKVNRNEPKRSTASEARCTRFEWDARFPDDPACLDYLVSRLYPDGIYCPKCEKVTKHHRENGRPSYECQFCGHHEHPMVGTIFQDSATSLKLWFDAIYLM